MRGYGQYCPIARGAEVFAERWTPIIVRNLHMGCRTFSEVLEGAPGLSRSLLSLRLRQLQHAGVVERKGEGRRRTYHLTDCGRELVDVCFALGVWGARWLESAPEDVDAVACLWSVSRLIDRTRLPRPRVTVRFDVTDRPVPNRFWLVLSEDEAEVCVKPPGHSEDLVVTADTGWLLRWHTGRSTLGEALRAGGLRLEGPPAMVRAFGRWGGVSPFAHVRPVRSAQRVRALDAAM